MDPPKVSPLNCAWSKLEWTAGRALFALPFFATKMGFFICTPLSQSKSSQSYLRHGPGQRKTHVAKDMVYQQES